MIWEVGKFSEMIVCVNVKGYGLMMGLYSCIVCVVEVIEVEVVVGNFYINCLMIGVVVGL